MTDDASPWREITTDDYAPRIYPDSIGGAAWIASTERVREMLKDQHAGLYRVRLVLREAVDFEPRFNRRPDWFWHYSSGPSLVMNFAEIVIERKRLGQWRLPARPRLQSNVGPGKRRSRRARMLRFRVSCVAAPARPLNGRSRETCKGLAMSTTCAWGASSDWWELRLLGRGGPRNSAVRLRSVLARALVGLLIVGSALPGGSTSRAQAESDRNDACHAASDLASPEPALTVNFPDPFVLCANGTFYAFATNSRGVNVQVARSADLKNWSLDRDPDGKPREALATPSWAVQDEGKRDVWAPEVIRLGTGYALFFSARHRFARRPDGDHRECIGVALSDRPDGGYRPDAVPLICPEFEEGVIDPSPYLEGDRLYLYFKADGNCCAYRTGLYVIELVADGRAPKGTARALGIINDQTWEGNVVEAPTMVRHGGDYVLFYSGNDYRSTRYGVAYAQCDGPLGPCSKPARSHVLGACAFRIVPPLDGPGHQSVFKADGRSFIAFHTVVNDPAGQFTDVRHLHVNELSWEDGLPTMKMPRKEIGADEGCQDK